MTASPRPVLPRAFYDRPTLEVAPDLLGKYLVRELDGHRRIGRIVEVEAYIGAEDLACHARFGKTARTWPMFGPPGHAYVYLIYGTAHMLNIVTEPEGCPAAVLVRALEPIDQIDRPVNGPGKLCAALAIDRRFSGHDLLLPPLTIEDWGDHPRRIVTTPRINIDYAGPWREKPWRFVDGDSRFLSVRLPRRYRER
ncbi:MAG: putative 3-methyladenine DNA glycosylase [Dehalococcoidia bacterium]|nr:MAG: putative 3-methyladenine DNA glycosylase [Dehalococcoidia bacterium]